MLLPGNATEHNADRVEGSALVWEIELTGTEARTLHARSQPGGGLDTGFVAVLAVVAVVVLLIVFAARACRRL